VNVDAYLALERLEKYRERLTRTEDKELREALDRAISAIRSKLFQALLDIQEFYVHTLDGTLPESQKTSETRDYAKKWEKHAPVPAGQVPTNTNSTFTRSSPPPPQAVREPPPPEPKDEVDGPLPTSNDTGPTETIVLYKGNGGLGFSISGGVDNNHIEGDPSIFITKIIPGLPADQDGRLKLDDEVISVNGRPLKGVTHADAVQSLRDAGNVVTLVVRHTSGQFEEYPPPPQSPVQRYVNITLKKIPGGGLGFSIAGGVDNMHVEGDDGIFVTKIIPGAAADIEGTLAVGDRIIKVDDNSMVGIQHGEAVSILKSTQGVVQLQVEKGAMQSMGIVTTPEPDPPIQPESQPDGTNAFSVDVQVTQAVDIEPYKLRKVTFERPPGTGLGFNIIGGEENFGIFISHINSGGIAEKSELVTVGDQILEVNAIDLRRVSHDTAAKSLKNAGTTVELLVEYRPQEFEQFQEEVNAAKEQQLKDKGGSPFFAGDKKSFYMKALHDYDATSDNSLPQLGLSFKHGDILHVLNAGSDEWWQAAHVDANLNDGPIALIPSKLKLEKRLWKQNKSVNFPSKGRGSASEDPSGDDRGSKKRRSFKMSKKFPFVKKDNKQLDGEEVVVSDEAPIPTYEPVKLEQKGSARPVIILGPLKDEINDMLVQDFPDEFAGCVPHTTRPSRPGEVDGRDYHFVSSVAQMEKDIQAHLFIEAGRYKENLYGTSIKAVRDVAEQGKHCILGVSGYAIRRLQAANLHPIALCMRPSAPNTILSALQKQGLTQDAAESEYDKGLKIEQEFVDYFTAVIEGDTLKEMYERVKLVIKEQSGFHIWVPSGEMI
jgi:guanylate kinase/C-terminal processing protease CtpA/Prc